MRLLESIERTVDGLRGPDPPARRWDRSDLLLALVAAALAMGVALGAARWLGTSLYTEGSLSLWFQADNPRVLANLVDPLSNQYRATVHPLFPIAFNTWLSVPPRLGASPVWTAYSVVLLSAGISAGALFLALRLAGRPRPVAALFTALFIASSGFLFWYSEIEIAPLSGATVCLALLALSFGTPRRRLPWVVMSITTLSMTITNWSAGLAATIARWPLRRAIQISAAALLIAMALALAQRLIYPTAGVFFSPRGLLAERQYSAGELHVWNPLESLRSLLIYSVVAPPPALLPDGAAKLVSIQHQPITAGGWPQVALSGLWCAVLALGFVGLWTRRNARQLAFGAGLMLLAQLAVGVLYGEESFLYAASIAPILVYVAAFAYDTKLKWLGLGATAAVVVFGGWNNAHQFMRASELAARAIGDGGNPVWSRYAAGRYILPVPRRTGP